MARNCNCSGASCGCLVQGGTGVVVSGIGTKANPYVIEIGSQPITGKLSVDDTTSVNLTLLGNGTQLDPYRLSAVVTGTPIRGTGSPEGVVAAAIGTMYINTSGGANTTLWIKTSGTGTLGWTAK